MSLTQITVHCVGKNTSILQCVYTLCVYCTCLWMCVCHKRWFAVFYSPLRPLSLLCSNTITRPLGHWDTHTQWKIKRNLSGLCKANNSFYNEGRGSKRKNEQHNSITAGQASFHLWGCCQHAAFSTTTWPEIDLSPARFPCKAADNLSTPETLITLHHSNQKIVRTSFPVFPCWQKGWDDKQMMPAAEIHLSLWITTDTAASLTPY